MNENNAPVGATTQPTQKKSKRLIGLSAAIIALAALICGGYFYYEANYAFPKPINPKEISFEWQYQHQTFSLKETLYESINGYYGKKPKGVFVGEENDSIAKYLNLPPEDMEVVNITNDLNGLAKQKNYSADQTAEFAVAFVQAIPYDFQKASTDLTHPDYPYEVLFSDKGICSDKSFLIDAILRRLGYKTAIFTFDKEEHMSAAIACPLEYSNFNSGFCMVESTAPGIKIGTIPEIKSDSQAIVRSEISGYQNDSTNASTVKLSNPGIFAKSDGKEYEGIVQTIALEKQITDLSNYLDEHKSTISQDETKLDQLKNQLDQFNGAGDYTNYNLIVPQYNALLKQIQTEIKEYNSKVSQYNESIKEYNS